MKNIFHGTLIQRKVARGQYAFVGLVYLDDPEGIQEGIGYLLDTSHGNTGIWPDPVLETPSDYDQLGIHQILTSEQWRATRAPGYTVVRTMPMGRGEPGLVIYGANTLPVVESPESPLDTLIHLKEDGYRSEFAPREKTLGMNIAQTLQLSGLFTKPDGTPVYLPVMGTEARQILMDIQKKRIQKINGELSPEEFDQWSRETEARHSLSYASRNDDEYECYLKAMDDMEALPGHLDYKTED